MRPGPRGVLGRQTTRAYERCGGGGGGGGGENNRKEGLQPSLKQKEPSSDFTPASITR